MMSDKAWFRATWGVGRVARGILFLSSFLLISFNFGEDLVHSLHLALFRAQI